MKNKNIYKFRLPKEQDGESFFYTNVHIKADNEEQANRMLLAHLAQRDSFSLISQIDFLGVKKQK
tara:strand:- start:544 stop:738 length:195 start_codon:yes stop_codon:yes gene_type:complete